MARRRSPKTALAEIFAGARRAIYVVDDRRRIVYANEALCAWLDRPLDDLLGTRCDFHSDDVPDSPAWAAGLCPPPEAFAGQTMNVPFVRTSTATQDTADESDQIRDGWLKRICNAFPAVRLQSIDECGFIGNAKRLGMGAQILAYVPKFDISIQTSAEMNEIVATLDGAVRVSDQYTDTRIGFGQYETFDDFEEIWIVVDSRLEVMGKNGDSAFRLTGNVDNSLTHFVLCRNNPTFAFFSCLFHIDFW